jgi:hypothetical protein
MKRAIVISGSLAQRNHCGGHTWVLLQFVLGFQRLGWDVLFLDRLEPGMCVGQGGEVCPFDRSLNLRYFLRIMEDFGLAGRFSLSFNCGGQIVGLSRQAVLERVGGSDLLLNIMGFLDDEEVLGRAPRRVFLDIDPGFGQMWRDLGLVDIFRGHDDYVTIGENIGQSDCAIPPCGLHWITTPQPVVLEHWPSSVNPASERFTSVVSWRGPFGPVEYHGKIYGLRVHEFRKFVSLPRLSRRPFELALDIHPSEVSDLALLESNGWSRVDPRVVASDPWTYRGYVQGSRAEIMVAKNMYVEANSGWLSDRSLCYLASGKPVLAQETGFSRNYPTGEGILPFRTLDEARAGVDEIERDYRRHARAARDLAEEYFESDKVLGRLLSKLGIA